jgi:signal recognition particle subunit SRP19
MRKQKKSIVWPVYLNSSETRKSGRKVPKNIAVPNPSFAEVQKAAIRLGLNPEAEVDAAHPAAPWRRTGRVFVESEGSKSQILIKIAKELRVMRQQTKK